MKKILFLLLIFSAVGCKHPYNRVGEIKFRNYRNRILINQDLLLTGCNGKNPCYSLQSTLTEISRDSLAGIVERHKWNAYQRDSFLTVLKVLANTAVADSFVNAGLKEIILDTVP